MSSIRLLWMAGVLVSFYCVSVFGSSPGLEPFNADFVAFLRGDASSIQMQKFAKIPEINTVRNFMKSAPGSYRVYALGQEICRADGFFQLCWSPVFKDGNVGILISGEREAFFSKATDVRGWKKEFSKRFKKHSKTSWYGIWMESAVAAEPVRKFVNDEQIAEFDMNLIIATKHGWEKRDTTENGLVENMKLWPESYLQDKQVICRSGSATMTLYPHQVQIEHSKAVNNSGELVFYIKAGDQLYMASLATPSSRKQCEENFYRDNKLCSDIEFKRKNIRYEKKNYLTDVARFITEIVTILSLRKR